MVASISVDIDSLMRKSFAHVVTLTQIFIEVFMSTDRSNVSFASYCQRILTVNFLIKTTFENSICEKERDNSLTNVLLVVVRQIFVDIFMLFGSSGLFRVQV